MIVVFLIVAFVFQRKSEEANNSVIIWLPPYLCTDNHTAHVQNSPIVQLYISPCPWDPLFTLEGYNLSLANSQSNPR